jgi:hypothetical protein
MGDLWPHPYPHPYDRIGVKGGEFKKKINIIIKKEQMDR